MNRRHYLNSGCIIFLTNKNKGFIRYKKTHNPYPDFYVSIKENYLQKNHISGFLQP